MRLVDVKAVAGVGRTARTLVKRQLRTLLGPFELAAGGFFVTNRRAAILVQAAWRNMGFVTVACAGASDACVAVLSGADRADGVPFFRAAKRIDFVAD